MPPGLPRARGIGGGGAGLRGWGGRIGGNRWRSHVAGWLLRVDGLLARRRVVPTSSLSPVLQDVPGTVAFLCAPLKVGI